MLNKLKVGSVVFHKDRAQHYMLLHRTSVKNEDGWRKGWVYFRCYADGVGFSYETNAEVFTRPDELFDADWTFVQ